jgi:hypothetical protein
VRALARVGLAGEIVATYALVRWSFRRQGLRGALVRLRAADGPAQHGPPVATGRRLGRAVGRTLALLPADSRCLMQSLVLTRVLARRGIDTRLVIGVRPGTRFAAHAWIEYDDQALLPAGGNSFDPLVTL